VVCWEAGSGKLRTFLDTNTIGQDIAVRTEYAKIVPNIASINQCSSISKSILFFSEYSADGIIIAE
jgi:hypothetical protein